MVKGYQFHTKKPPKKQTQKKTPSKIFDWVLDTPLAYLMGRKLVDMSLRNSAYPLPNEIFHSRISKILHLKLVGQELPFQ